jgi:hypothetical protein
MLVVAAGAHNSASIPLLVIGGGWFVMGLGGLRTQRTVAREVQLEDGRVTFVFPSKRLTVPASEITEIRRPHYDINRVCWLDFQTTSNGKIRVTPRLRGMVDLLIALRAVNPDLKLGDSV